MKNNKYLILLILISSMVLNSCDTFDLDLTANPNELTEDKAVLNNLMNTIQVDFANYTEQMGRLGSQLTRIENMRGRVYQSTWSAGTTNAPWRIAYANILSDMRIAERLSIETEAHYNLGVLKVIKSSIFITLVDYFGDVPFSEATQPETFQFPNTDDDASVYEACEVLLNEAISDLEIGGTSGFEDFYYSGESQWIKAANSLKLRIYANVRLVDATAASKFNAIIGSLNYITSSADDFQFQYGTQEVNPNTRHDAYDADYTATGGGRYRSNWLMNEMQESNDPRIRYFFYRQDDCTPGSGCASEADSLPCSSQSGPTHYPAGMVWCTMDNGYWGKDHGFNQGIPPDSGRRTIVGVYPAGGKFDDNSGSNAGLGAGGQGAGITPIMLASWIDLMQSEIAMASNPSNGLTFLTSAMQKSIDKVMSFGSVDPGNDGTFTPTAGDVSTYINDMTTAFMSANDDGKWEIFAKQYLISHYGNGTDAYNFYRRTGFPHSLQYNIERSSGNFPRSLLYAAIETTTNPNISQKTNLNGQIFWDNNPSSADYNSTSRFPFAN